MDGVGAMMFAASLGVGVIFSSITVFVFEGAIVMLAGVDVYKRQDMIWETASWPLRLQNEWLSLVRKE